MDGAARPELRPPTEDHSQCSLPELLRSLPELRQGLPTPLGAVLRFVQVSLLHPQQGGGLLEGLERGSGEECEKEQE